MSSGKNIIEHEIRPSAGTIDAAHADIEEVNNSTRAMVSNIRQGFQLAIFTAQAVGFVIDQSLLLLIEMSLLAIEVGAGIVAGVPFGLTQIVQIGAIIAMGVLIVQLKQQRTSSARRTQAMVSGLRMVGFRSSA